jgi:uncharacterized protein (TIGR02058 family)
MKKVRCVTEMGMGVDVRGNDPTKAACRAVSDAIRHSSLNLFGLIGKKPQDMLIDVLIGVPSPERVDATAVAAELPYGRVSVRVEHGGLAIAPDGAGDPILIANAAVLVHFEVDDDA